MEIGYHARRTLVPVIMEWIMNSRMKEHILKDSFLVSFLEDSLYFHLSNLTEAYQQKHILPNLAVYSLSLFHNLTPTIENWCAKNNIQKIEFDLVFRCEDLRYQTKRKIQVKKDNKALTDYLDQKST